MGRSWKTREIIKIFDFIDRQNSEDQIIDFVLNYADNKFTYGSEIEWENVSREITTQQGKRVNIIFIMEYLSKEKDKRVIFGALKEKNHFYIKDEPCIVYQEK